MKMAQSLQQAARWFVVIAATIALVAAFSLPSLSAPSASSTESVAGCGFRRGCGGHRHRVHRFRGYRHGGCSSYSSCGYTNSPCNTGGCNVGGGCTIGGGCY